MVFIQNIINKTQTLVCLFLLLLFDFLYPTSILAGFIGPYDGKVVDGDTGEPISNASVLIGWIKMIPTPAGAYSTPVKKNVLTCTNEKGIYCIPLTFAYLGFPTVLAETKILIYAPGYKSYFETISHFDPYGYTKQSNFKNKGNIVNLVKITPHFNHENHFDKIDRFISDLYIRTYDYGYQENIEQQIKDETTNLNLQNILTRAEWEKYR